MSNPEAWRDFFPSQECPACGLEHPGQPCPQQDLFEGDHEQAS